MNPPLPPIATIELTAAASRNRVLAVLATAVVFWVALSALGALTSLNDDLRHGVQGSYWLIFLAWGRSSLISAGLSFVLYLCFSRWPRFYSSAKMIAAGYGLTLLLLLPTQLVFLAKLYLDEDGPGLTWASIQDQVKAFDKFTSLLDLYTISAIYVAVVAIKLWQQSQARARAWAQAQADSLALSLELEQQRSLALRAQLEPHFMFNALNAISALVRSDNKDAALTGIRELSELLRYALSASDRSWVKLADELRFVEDYLALQRLRYGARLQLTIEGAESIVLDCDCLPLLLQPLVENALRHDLDCHAQASDIHLSFELHNECLSIRISNPVRDGAALNPGTGLGLRNIEGRLQLAYGGAASMQAGVVDGRFLVKLQLPAQAPE
jgi:hypothetical protein